MDDLSWMDADSFVPVTGYRLWDIPAPDSSNRLLRRRGTDWLPDAPTVAECKAATGRALHNHEAPQQSCGSPPLNDIPSWLSTGCGLHAYYTPELANTNCDVIAYRGWVLGVVIGWGRVLFDDNFWRAQYARIVAFADPATTSLSEHKNYHHSILAHVPEAVADLAQLYGVPVVPLEELEEYAGDYGEPFGGHTREEERMERKARAEHERKRKGR